MRGKTVLVIDDIEDARTILSLWLQAHDFETLVADSASQALAILSQKTPDLIFLDYHMPDMDGIQLLRILKKTEGLRGVPVVVFSGNNYSEQAIDAGANLFLRKGDALWEEIPSIALRLCQSD